MEQGTQQLFDGLVDGDDLTIRLPVFEGPLDLLLFLIRRNEVSIYDIPIETVTKQYLAVLNTMEELNLEVAGEFFVMAATLMYIKSRMLLPREKRPAAESEEEGEDPRWELVQQLLEYRGIKEAAEELEERISIRNDYLTRAVVPEANPLSERPLKPFDRFDVWNAFNLVLHRLGERLQVGVIHEEPVTVAERMSDIVKALGSTPRLRFFDLLGTGGITLYYACATFLALLELTRLRTIDLQQDESFGDILICRAEPAAPED